MTLKKKKRKRKEEGGRVVWSATGRYSVAKETFFRLIVAGGKGKEKKAWKEKLALAEGASCDNWAFATIEVNKGREGRSGKDSFQAQIALYPQRWVLDRSC